MLCVLTLKCLRTEASQPSIVDISIQQGIIGRVIKIICVSEACVVFKMYMMRILTSCLLCYLVFVLGYPGGNWIGDVG